MNDEMLITQALEYAECDVVCQDETCLKPILKHQSIIVIGRNYYHAACLFNTLDRLNTRSRKIHVVPNDHHLYGCCINCGNITVRGICKKCGWGAVCSGCLRVRYPDGTWHKTTVLPTQISHTLCPPCIIELYPREAAIMEAKKRKTGVPHV